MNQAARRKLTEWQNEQRQATPTIRVFTAEAPKPTFVPPTSIADGERRRVELLGKIQAMQASLSDDGAAASTGKPLTGDEYRTWRANTRRALAVLEDEHRRVKAWVKEHKETTGEGGDWPLLRRIHRLLDQISTEDATIHTDELDGIMDAIERKVPAEYLERGGAT